jgi:hypothetical protein
MVHTFLGMEGSAMGQILNGYATTTAAVRRAIQHSQESLSTLAARYSVNQKTVAKRKKRSWECQEFRV